MKYYPQKEARIPFTKVGFKKIQEEKAKLMAERPEAVDNLHKSREMGDLSENGYYKASRARLSFIDAQIRRVDRLIKLAVIVESTNSGKVDIGSNVEITDGKINRNLKIVGGYESNPLDGTVSYMSPIGKALMGKSVNDLTIVHAPAGNITYTIKKIS
jgi:transcription elongation factor GreA